MLKRLRERKEWKLFAVLPKADRALAAAWWTVLVLRGFLPALFVVDMGDFAKVNEIMSAVTERYGRDSHVIMGAVIDEDLQGRVEVCVIGTSDIGGRLPPRRPSGRNRAPETLFAPTKEIEIARMEAAEPVAAGALDKVPAKAKNRRTDRDESQNEFFFQTLAENRGHFERTDRNLFEGQDLDVPTYLRKGIKINL